jgi:hypothetical protein
LSSKPESSPKESSDFVVIGGRSANGEGVGVLRCREGRVEIGQVQPLKEGKPIHGEVVRLHPHADCPVVCDVEVQVPAPRSEVRQSGRPAQVANDRYRANWDAIFGRDSDAELN